MVRLAHIVLRETRHIRDLSFHGVGKAFASIETIDDLSGMIVGIEIFNRSFAASI